MDLRKVTPDDITSDETKLYIKWKDGFESVFDLLDLRRRCPCAVCRGGHEGNVGDATGHINAISLRGWKKVGRYALSFEWSDNHTDGIYPFEGLRRYSEDPKSEID